MLATDAGGESINLQFCNQMVNYDIPWNPNKLEQRMGRIHRIGQKNEVFVFNLVAGNTREGDVMRTLLKKIEQMRKDLGKDLVFDFIGDILDDNDLSLAELMQESVLNRQNLDQIIEGIDRVLSREHQRLLQAVAEERLDEESIDLPGMRREQNNIFLNRVPSRIYARFTIEALTARKVAIAEGEGKESFRIEHFRALCLAYFLALRIGCHFVCFIHNNQVKTDIPHQVFNIVPGGPVDGSQAERILCKRIFSAGFRYGGAGKDPEVQHKLFQEFIPPLHQHQGRNQN